MRSLWLHDLLEGRGAGGHQLPGSPLQRGERKVRHRLVQPLWLHRLLQAPQPDGGDHPRLPPGLDAVTPPSLLASAPMRAVLFDKPGDESVLHVGEVEAPPLGPNDLRIRVAGAGVNRADLLQRRGMYPPPPGASPLIGLECAGEGSEVGANVRGWKTGGRAMALLAGGGYAEQVVVDAGSPLPVPKALSGAEAAALPEVYLTVFSNVFQIGGLA